MVLQILAIFLMLPSAECRNSGHRAGAPNQVGRLFQDTTAKRRFCTLLSGNGNWSQQGLADYLDSDEVLGAAGYSRKRSPTTENSLGLRFLGEPRWPRSP